MPFGPQSAIELGKRIVVFQEKWAPEKADEFLQDLHTVFNAVTNEIATKEAFAMGHKIALDQKKQ